MGWRAGTRITFTGSQTFNSRIRSDQNLKLNSDLHDQNCRSDNCNCSGTTCVLKDQNCRQTNSIYEIRCLVCPATTSKTRYLGNTGRTPKTRIREHLSMVKSKFNTGTAKNSDSFLRHFESHFGEITQKFGSKISLGTLRSMTESKVVKQCKGTIDGSYCCLCAWERYLIYVDQESVINTRTELFGACRHTGKLKFFTTEEAWRRAEKS